jgi:hypothetical protein
MGMMMPSDGSNGELVPFWLEGIFVPKVLLAAVKEAFEAVDASIYLTKTNPEIKQQADSLLLELSACLHGKSWAAVVLALAAALQAASHDVMEVHRKAEEARKKAEIN